MQLTSNQWSRLYDRIAYLIQENPFWDELGREEKLYLYYKQYVENVLPDHDSENIYRFLRATPFNRTWPLREKDI